MDKHEYFVFLKGYWCNFKFYKDIDVIKGFFKDIDEILPIIYYLSYVYVKMLGTTVQQNQSGAPTTAQNEKLQKQWHVTPIPKWCW